jgi:homoserine kinase type II
MRHRPPRPEPPPYWSDLLAPWGIPAATLAPALGGVNNRCWFVESASGRYVLRVYSVASREAVRLEHALLVALSAAALPFATPRPVAAEDGSTCPVVMTPEGPRIAALFERIEGENLDDDDVAGVEAAAAAFAQLDVVLAQLEIDREYFDGNLERVHPLVQDLTSLDELGADATALVRGMAGEPSRLRGLLEPRQLVHGDFAFGNVLLVGGRVVGVLDFEFAGEDARAAELAMAVRLVLSKRSRERIWRPLLRGYLRTLPLSEAELAALPLLALHQEAVVLVWWLGRHRAGDVGNQRLEEHIERALALEALLMARDQDIVREARRHSSPG